VAFKNDPAKLALGRRAYSFPRNPFTRAADICGHLPFANERSQSARSEIAIGSRAQPHCQLWRKRCARFSLAIARTRPPAHIVCPRTSGSSCPRGDAATEIRFPDYRSHRRENSIFHAIRPSSRPPSPSHRRRRLGCGARRRDARLYERTYLPGRTVSE